MSTDVLDKSFYYDDFKKGLSFETYGRTIQKVDITNFAGVTGDYSQLHVNEEYAKTTIYKKPVAHGMLTFSYVLGLAIQTGFIEKSIIAFAKIENWEFKRPIFVGDTVRARISFVGKEDKSFRSNVTGGKVINQLEVLNQKNKICQSGLLHFFVRDRW